MEDKKKQLEASKEGLTPEGRDILTLLIKSILALETSGEDGDQAMSEDEVLGRKHANSLLNFRIIILKYRDINSTSRRTRNNQHNDDLGSIFVE